MLIFFIGLISGVIGSGCAAAVFLRRVRPGTRKIAKPVLPYLLEPLGHSCGICARSIRRLFERLPGGEQRYVGVFCIGCGKEFKFLGESLYHKDDGRDYHTVVETIVRVAMERVSSDPTALRGEIAELQQRLDERRERLIMLETAAEMGQLPGPVTRAP